MRYLTARCLTVSLAIILTGIATPQATATPGDSFYRYSGSTPLSAYPPGTVLRTRVVPYHLLNVPTPLRALQILYRSTDAQGRAVANVTSVLRPKNAQPNKAVAYQSYYDSLNPDDGPSRAIAGDAPLGRWTPSGQNLNVGGVVPTMEIVRFARLYKAGYTVVIPDTEGPTAAYGVGPIYGMMALDSLRAVQKVAATGITARTKFAIVGYSGGAIATSWAAILAPSYAPEINTQLVGAAQGGILVNPANNLRYVPGPQWGGVPIVILVALARSYGVSFNRYLNTRGRAIVARFQDASIGNILFQYPGLTMQSLLKPNYRNPNSIPEYVTTINKLNMGTAPTPTIPMFIVQGANGRREGGTSGGPGIGATDGVIITGDVRSLARKYCAAGLNIQYNQYNSLGHGDAQEVWTTAILPWIADRFTGKPAPNNCAHIAPGNSLAPEKSAAPEKLASPVKPEATPIPNMGTR